MYDPAERFVREKDLQHGPANLQTEEAKELLAYAGFYSNLIFKT